jgi:NAD(P)-dependent dehydrogenase (short-subunit alcohol dehydrogenase family)
MIASAGIGILRESIEVSLADWRRQTAVNFDGVFLSVKYAVPAMRRADRLFEILQPFRARSVARLAGPRVGAFWRLGDPAWISLPGPAWLGAR